MSMMMSHMTNPHEGSGPDAPVRHKNTKLYRYAFEGELPVIFLATCVLEVSSQKNRGHRHDQSATAAGSCSRPSRLCMSRWRSERKIPLLQHKLYVHEIRGTYLNNYCYNFWSAHLPVWPKISNKPTLSTNWTRESA